MQANDHPYFDEEKNHLDLTLQHIRERLNKNFDHGATYRLVKNSLQDIYNGRSREYREAEKKAYFGRVDLEGEDGQIETLYIADHPLQETDLLRVYSWKADKVGQWYYNGAPNRLLKRTFQINYDELHSINDEYVDPKLSDKLLAGQFTDSLLFKLLQENRSGELRNIVATIQAQQYRIIQSPLDQLLVIQGVAGSGKSAIALHRVAYLIYNNKHLKNILILGPNRMFMEYMAQVLPSLGERNIPQMPVDEWLLEKLGTKIEYTSIDNSIEMFMSAEVSQSHKLLHYRASSLKGSLKMAELVERYIKLLDISPITYDNPLICNITRTSLRTNLKSIATAQRSAEQIKELLLERPQLPLHLKREEVRKALISSISDEILKKIREDMEKTGSWVSQYGEADFRKKIENEVSSQVTRQLQSWQKIDVVQAYRKLLRTPDLLFEAGQGIFSRTELALLAQETPRAQSPYKFTDLTAMVYLKLLLDGPEVSASNKLIDHIVIDEAQDLSPLHFKVISCYLRNISMTVLGDSAQGIYTHTGVTKWEELEQTVGRPIHKEVLSQTYRSTQQITDFANKLLRKVEINEATMAEPIARLGPLPKVHSFASTSEEIKGLIGILEDEQRAGKSSIAVICKTANMCQTLTQQLQTEGFSNFYLLTNRNASFKAGVAIIPAYLTKGLEFDVVIIIDAGSNTYPCEVESARLLYVALTRASHSLHICHTGPITPLLDDKLDRLNLQASIPVQSKPQTLTLSQFVAKHPNLDLNTCVEYLASIDKLYLLADGQVEELLFDILFDDKPVNKIIPNLELLSITEQRILDWTKFLTTRHKDKKVAKEVNQNIALIQLIYGVVSSQLSLKTKQKVWVEQKLLAKQVITLNILYQLGGQISRLKWVEESEFTSYVVPAHKTRAQQLISKFIQQGFIEEDIRQGQNLLRIAEDSLQYFLERVLQSILDSKNGK